MYASKRLFGHQKKHTYSVQITPIVFFYLKFRVQHTWFSTVALSILSMVAIMTGVDESSMEDAATEYEAEVRESLRVTPRQRKGTQR